MSAKTESEDRFEQYLTGQNLTWNRIPESNRREPDYTVRHGDSNCIFEEKSLMSLRQCPPQGTARFRQYATGLVGLERSLRTIAITAAE